MNPARPFVVHADDQLVVIDKPSGLPAVTPRPPKDPDCAAARVQAQWSDAQVVHRLDRDTSGLMLLARGADAQRTLSRAFERREVDKRYVALVWGVPPLEAGTIDLPLGADWENRPRQHVDLARGKPSITHWRRDDTGEAPAGLTRLLLRPVTGRSHQLRVHLAALGHPIAGDPLYAPPEAQAAASRLMLHAARLGFTHPSTGESVVFESPAPF